MKWMNECSLGELYKRRKLMVFFDFVCLIFGGIYEIVAFYFYLNFGLVFISLIVFIGGLSLLLLAILPNNLSMMIYLKEMEGKK